MDVFKHVTMKVLPIYMGMIPTKVSADTTAGSAPHIHGDDSVFQYSMSSWFNQGILNADKYPTWVASYGSSDCGTRGNIVAWQYTSSWGGGSQDMSYDWGIFGKQPAKIEATVQPKVEPQKPKVENIIKLTEQTHPVDRLGIERPETYEAGSTWKSSDIVMINNEPHYQIATDIFVPISKTTFKDFIIVKYTDGSPAASLSLI